MGYSSDFMPHLGALPGKEGQFIIAGFSGHGMPEILLSSKGVAAMVRDGVAFEDTGLPRIFKTTKERISRQDSPLEESLLSLWSGNNMAKL
jgi:glycine/D-amino acid oxidase-like deaminating enzyme